MSTTGGGTKDTQCQTPRTQSMKAVLTGKPGQEGAHGQGFKPDGVSKGGLRGDVIRQSLIP